MKNRNNIIEIRDVSYLIEGKKILYDINFNIKPRNLITIIGANGSGKTSLAKILTSSIKPSSGSVNIKKHVKIGYVPQKIHFDKFIPLKVKDFLKLKKSYRHNIEKYLQIIDIRNLFNVQISRISGGELQKVLLMYNLIDEPNLLIMDEVTQGLDINSQTEFYKLIDYLRKDSDISILMISHDLHMVMKTTDYVLCINKHICCQGKPQNIIDHPNFNALFDKDTINNFSAYAHNHNHNH